MVQNVQMKVLKNSCGARFIAVVELNLYIPSCDVQTQANFV